MPNLKRILIVDDDPQVLFILKKAIERMGDEFEIVTTSNGRQALKLIHSERLDLIISDVRMPEINGIMLVEAVREAHINTTCIWITAYGCSSLQPDRDRLGVFDCLEKPLRINEIRHAVLHALKEEPDANEHNPQLNYRLARE